MHTLFGKPTISTRVGLGRLYQASWSLRCLQKKVLYFNFRQKGGLFSKEMRIVLLSFLSSNGGNKVNGI